MDASLAVPESYTQIQTHVGVIAMRLLDERMSPKIWIMFTTSAVGELSLDNEALDPVHLRLSSSTAQR